LGQKELKGQLNPTIRKKITEFLMGFCSLSYHLLVLL
jgi:hypothetical protein